MRWPCPRPLGRRERSDITAEFGLKSCPLVRSETTNTPGLGNAEPLHDLLCPHLADTRHRLEQCRDLHLADDVVRLAVLEYLGQRRRATLELVLDLGALFAGPGSLLQSGSTLIGCEGRKCHAGSPRVSYRKTRFGRGN